VVARGRDVTRDGVTDVNDKHGACISWRAIGESRWWAIVVGETRAEGVPTSGTGVFCRLSSSDTPGPSDAKDTDVWGVKEIGRT
jgi:hypothetical protein